MSSNRVLRCSPRAYQEVAKVAGEMGITLSEALDTIVLAPKGGPKKDPENNPPASPPKPARPSLPGGLGRPSRERRDAG